MSEEKQQRMFRRVVIVLMLCLIGFGASHSAKWPKAFYPGSATAGSRR